MSNDCISRNELVRYANGELSADAEHVVKVHVSGCARCRAVVDEIVAPTRSSTGGAGPVEPSAPMPTGATLERFVLLGELGAGGMGRVYGAWDPRLARRVALKVVRHEVLARLESRRDGLMNEARAMAQLSHPNVLTVHDVFDVDGQLVIAMEFVQGATLRTWLRGGQPLAERWRLVLEAGRGLEAAHARGVLHRDFKPENVLVSEDGRVRVADFGLAHFVDHGEQALLAGTHGYLAPEANAGRADVRTDQYAFAVTAWEVLGGTKPSAEGRGEVPGAAAQVLRRALADDPAARFPSMTALLEALERARRSPARRVQLTAGALVLVAVAGAGVAQARQEQLACAEGETLRAAVLPEARADAIRKTFEASGAEAAAHIAGDVLERTNRLGADWATGWLRACKAVRVAPVGARGLEEARLACFRRKLVVLEVLTDEWTRASKDSVGDAQAALAAVANRLDCEALTPESYLALPKDPQQARDALARRQSIDRLYARADAMSDARRAELAPEVEKLLAEARAANDFVATAGTALLLTRLDFLSNRESVDYALVALRAALAASDYENAALAAIAVGTSMNTAEQAAEGLRWLEVAEGLAARTSSDSLRGNIAISRGLLLGRAKRYDEATASLRAGLAAWLTASGEDSLDVAMARNNLASALQNQGQLVEARELLELALATRRKRLGEQHSALLAIKNNLGDLLVQTGHTDEGVAMLEEVLARLGPVNGKPHPRRYFTLSNHIAAMLLLRRTEDARRDLEEMRQLVPPKTEVSARVDRFAAAVALLDGKPQEALDDVAAADALVTSLGMMSAGWGVTSDALRAEAFFQLGRLDEARAEVKLAREHLQPATTVLVRQRIERVEAQLGLDAGR